MAGFRADFQDSTGRNLQGIKRKRKGDGKPLASSGILIDSTIYIDTTVYKITAKQEKPSAVKNEQEGRN